MNQNAIEKNEKFPMIPLIIGNSEFRSYKCPYCDNTILHGYIKNISMTCYHCYSFINEKGVDLI